MTIQIILIAISVVLALALILCFNNYMLTSRECMEAKDTIRTLHERISAICKTPMLEAGGKDGNVLLSTNFNMGSVDVVTEWKTPKGTERCIIKRFFYFEGDSSFSFEYACNCAQELIDMLNEPF